MHMTCCTCLDEFLNQIYILNGLFEFRVEPEFLIQIFDNLIILLLKMNINISYQWMSLQQCIVT